MLDPGDYLIACQREGMGGIWPAYRIILTEIQCGSRLIGPGELDLYRLDEMLMTPVIVQRGDDLRIVAIAYRREFRGKHRFVDMLGKIMRAGLKPVIVEPIGPDMPKIMERLVWRGAEVQQPNGGWCTEFRPASLGNIGALGPGFPRFEPRR